MKVFANSDLNCIVICLVILILLLCLYLEYDRMSISNLVNQNPQNDSFQNTSNTCNNNDNDPLCNYFENEGNTTLRNIKTNIGTTNCYLRKIDTDLELDFLRGNNKLAKFDCANDARQKGDLYKVEESQSNKYTIKDQDDCQLKMRRGDDSIKCPDPPLNCWVDGRRGQRIVYFDCPNGNTSNNQTSNDIGDFELTGLDSSSFGLYAKIPK